MKKASIIVRTKNEERWVAHCLQAIEEQSYPDFEIILVDNESTDHTVRVAKRFGISAVVNVSEYKPGFALNEGIRAATGDYIVCLSAHCIPADGHWLESLVTTLEEDERYAGVYGRQLPVSYTSPVDKRDLMTVFGLDRRVQIKDYFFHNANSIIRREAWEKTPFDEDVPNIEDRVWGQEMINAGYRLVYEPAAAVYHHHGLNHGNDQSRASGVVSVLEKITSAELPPLPETLRPDNCHISVMIPILSAHYDQVGPERLGRLINEIKAAKTVDSCFVLTEDANARDAARDHDIEVIVRPDQMASPSVTLGELFKFGLDEIESRGIFPEALIFADSRYVRRPANLFDDLINHAQYNGLDTVFPGYVDYHNYWRLHEDGVNFEAIGDPLVPRIDKVPLYRALYGLGSVISAPIARQGKLVGGQIGIIPIYDHAFAERIGDDATP